MGYLFALVVVGLWTLPFSAKSPEVSLTLFFVGSAIVGLFWIKNNFDEAEAKRRREQREQERIKSVRENFKKLQMRIITNNEQEPYAFHSLFDATRSFVGKPYSYPRIRELYFVVNGNVTTPYEVEIIEAFLTEFYDVYQHSAADKKPLLFIEESKESRAEKVRLTKQREAERQRILEIALADIDGRTKDDVGDAGSSLYIMVSKLGVKIGISDEPQKRLSQVQTGHPAKVSLSKVIWFFSRGEAALVEKTVHDLLKLRDAHASGEWFNIKFGEASDVIGKVVRELIQKGEVDSHRRETQSEKAGTDLDLALARLISLQWKISKRGNEWLRLGDKNITIFPQRSRWSFVCAGEYGKSTFDTKKEAKVAALQLYLERYGESLQN